MIELNGALNLDDNKRSMPCIIVNVSHDFATFGELESAIIIRYVIDRLVVKLGFLKTENPSF